MTLCRVCFYRMPSSLWFTRRNSKVGYCQGLNGVVAYFLTKGFSEEASFCLTQECFWILTYLIEEIIPRDYYTNMLSLRADIQILTRILYLKDPKLLQHFKSLQIDMSLIMVENFLTVFTNTCHPEISSVIIDHLLIDGPVVLIKAMMLILRYLRKVLLEIDNFGSFRMI